MSVKEMIIRYMNLIARACAVVLSYSKGINDLCVVQDFNKTNEDMKYNIALAWLTKSSVIDFIRYVERIIDEVEKADQIITIGDIYRKNSLIGRRIIHAKENDAKTINIYTETNLTGFNSDEFKQIESFDELNQVLDSIDFTENTIIIINEIRISQFIIFSFYYFA